MAVLNNQISGTFVSDGTAKVLNLPCGVNYIKTLNYTQMATTANPGVAVECEWYSTMPADSAVVKTKTNSTNALNGSVVTSNGFTALNTSVPVVSAPLTITGVSQANPAVVSLAATTGLVAGDTVRIFNVPGMHQIDGMDFTIASVVANTSFTLAYLNSSGFAAAGTGGSIRKIQYDSLYYPKRLYITNISQATQAVFTFSVTHGLTVGQVFRAVVPAAFGMTQMNGLACRIVSINTGSNTVTVDVDSSGFTAFAFPTSGSVPFTFAEATPFGDLPLTVANPLGNQSVLDGSTRNIAVQGIRLAAGTGAPAGASSDVIHWVASVSSQVQTS